MGWVEGIMAVISAAGSAYGGASAKSGSKKAAKAQAKDETILTQDKLFTLRQEEKAIKGQTVAGAAGSGVQVGTGSPMEILAEQTRNFMREMNITARVGATRASLTQQRGKMVGNQAAYQGYANAASTMANAFAMFAKT